MFEYKCTKCGRIAWHPPYFEYTPIKSVPPARIELGWCNNCDRMAYIFTGEASKNEEEAKEFYKKHCSSARCLTCESEIEFSSEEQLGRHSCGGELKHTFSRSRIHYSSEGDRLEGDTVYYNSKGIIVPDFDEDGLTNRIHFDL